MSFYGKTLSKIEKAFSSIKFHDLKTSDESHDIIISAKNAKDTFTLLGDGFSFTEIPTDNEFSTNLRISNDALPKINNFIGQDAGKTARQVAAEETNKILQGGTLQSKSTLQGEVSGDVLKLSVVEKLQ